MSNNNNKRKRKFSTMMPNATSTPLSAYSVTKNQEKGFLLSPVVERNVSKNSWQTASIRGRSSYHHLTKLSESSKFNSVKYAPLVVNSESEDSEYEFEITTLTSGKNKVKRTTLKEERNVRKKDDQVQVPEVGVKASFDGLKRKSSTKFRPMGDKSLDAFIKQVGENRDILIQPLSRIQKKKFNQPLSKQVENKENIVGKINEVDLFIKKKMKPSENKGVPATALLKEETLKSFKFFPEVYSPENFQWKDSKQEGISTFKLLSTGFIKIKPKYKLTKNINLEISSHVKAFIIIVGNAVVTLNSNKTKVGPGAAVMVTTDWSIMNTGVSKNLILLCIEE